MKKTILIILSIVIFLFFTIKGRYFYDEFSYGLYLLALLTSMRILIIHYSACVLIIYTLLNGIYFSFVYPSPFEKYGFAGENLLKLNSAQSLVTIFAMVIPLVFISKKILKLMSRSLPWLCLISSVIIIYNTFINKNYSLGGAMGNSSMDPMMIAFLYPTLFSLIDKKIWEQKIFKYFAVAIPLIAIILSKGSIGLGCICISLFFLLVTHKKTLFKGLFLFSFLTLTLFFLASLNFEGRVLDDSHRFWIYKAAYEWWVKFENIWVGSGLGTYWGIGPMSQNLYWKTRVFSGNGVIPIVTWMHSDWLQILFELGIVGLFLSIFCAYHLVRNCLKNNRPWLLASILSYSGAMIFNMPLHWFLSSLSGAILIRIGFMNASELEFIEQEDCPGPGRE